MNQKLHRIAQQGGFTLVEMLIVVAIIAVIVSIAVPAMRDMKAEAQRNKETALTYAIEQAKQRAVIESTVTPGTPATWNQFRRFLNIGGVEIKTDADLVQITSAQNNGTGKNIWWWGKYPNLDGTQHAPVNFSSVFSPITAMNWTYNSLGVPTNPNN